MKNFALRMTALAPLAIRSDQAVGGVETANTIPGATFLGSLAAAHRMLRPEREEEFARFFLTEQVYYPHLYPATFKHEGFNKSNLPVMPLPKTAQTCKRFSGFPAISTEEETDEPHGVRDSLLHWGIFALLNRQHASISALLSPFQGHDVCAYQQGKYQHAPCEQAMSNITGYYRRDSENFQMRMQPDIEKRLQTRTGINRQWGVVEDNILYNREVFDEQMRFWGEVVLPDDLAHTFKQFVDEANKEDVICVGTGRTRGLGRVSVEMREQSRSNATDFTEKLHKFNDTMQQHVRAADMQQHPFYVAITLQSPTILCDPFLRYQKTIDATTLASLLELSPAAYPLELLYQSVEMQRITGWNELAGTPRTNDYAMEMGSTFLYACSQEQDSTLTQALQTIAETGIGRRRTEGFGRISISDPFHLESD